MKTTLMILFLLIYTFINGQIPHGFDALFNGTDLKGWEIKAKPDDAANTFWTVEDGAIVVNSLNNADHDYVWLINQNEYDNFELQLKFAAYKSNKGNSGLQIRSRYDDEKQWLNGPQIDIHPSEPWRTGFIWDETDEEQRWIYPDIPKGENVNESMREKPVTILYSDEKEQWNKLEVYADGNKIQAWLNGEKITDFKNKEILNNEVHKKHNVGKNGHIALQLHTGDELYMKFKDIFVKAL